MPAPQLRWYDTANDRLVTASPNLLMVWKGAKPGEAIAGPHALTVVPRSVDDVREAYFEWIEAGEPK